MSDLTDAYTIELLTERFNSCVELYKLENEWKQKITGMRHSNLPEDLTENLAKFIIRKYDNDPTIIWAKNQKINGKKIPGDLYSVLYDIDHQPEVKSFTSNGPIQFGPNKKFGVLYFLDLRKFTDDIIVLWRANLTHETEVYRNIKMNKLQTHSEQCEEGRRPRINWEGLYPQIKEHCVKIFEGTFSQIIARDL